MAAKPTSSSTTTASTYQYCCSRPTIPELEAGGDGATPASALRPVLRGIGLFVAGFTVVFIALGATASGFGRLLSAHEVALAHLSGAVSVNPHAIGAASGLYGFTQMAYGALCTIIVEVWRPGSVFVVAAVLLVSAVLGQVTLSLAVRRALS